MKKETAFLKQITSFVVANTTDKEIETSLFAPDVNGLENKFVRDDLSPFNTYIKYRQIQRHISKNDELVTMLRVIVLNPKDDRLLFQTEGNEVITPHNIHGKALNLMTFKAQSIDSRLMTVPILNTNINWDEEPTHIKNIPIEFTASNENSLEIKIPPYTAYRIDLLRDSTVYLNKMKGIFPLNNDVYNSLQYCFSIYNELNKLVPFTLEEKENKEYWGFVKDKENQIFRTINNILKYIEKNKTKSDIVLLYNKVKHINYLINNLTEDVTLLIENDKKNDLIKKKEIKKAEADKLSIQKNKTKSNNKKVKPEFFDPLNTKIVVRDYYKNNKIVKTTKTSTRVKKTSKK